MRFQSTSKVAISTLIAFSSVVSGAAVELQNAEIEARDPQFGGLSGLFSGFSLPSFNLPSFTLPAFPGATSTSTTSTAAAVTTSTTKTTPTSTTKATTTSTTSVVSSVSSVKSAPASSVAKSSSSSKASTVVGTSSKVSAATGSSSKAATAVSTSSKVSAATGSSSKAPATGSSSKASITPSASGSSCPRPPRSTRSLKPSGSGANSSSKKAASGSAANSSSKKAASGSAVSSAAGTTAVGASCLSKPSSISSKSRRRPNHSIGHCSAGPCTSSGSAVSKAATSSSVSSSASTTLTSQTQIITSTSASSALTTQSQTPITVTGPSATISNGVVVGSALPGGINQYLGIPYAQPPVGQLRLKPPVALTSNLGLFNANTLPASCPQLAMNLTGNYSAGGLQPLINEFVFTPTVQQEDCLTINVWAPNNTTPQSNLPVVFWIYGGGFEFGATAMYNGSAFVSRSVSLGAPVIFVEVNYRLGGFGFLGGADLAGEVSTNLGLRDQRLGLEWVADNIKSFGGDPTKVTLWGESAGAISSCFQTTVNGGNNTYKGQALFRASIHNSGCFAPADNTTAPQAQAIYDTVLANAGCSGSTAAERLSCLRSVPYEVLHNATYSVPIFGSYRSVDLSYLPRPDTGDNFFTTSAEIAIASGKWTKTPFIIGDQQDEGTLFAIVLNNITSSDQFINYLATWFPNNPNAVSDTAGLVNLYSTDPADGSPFNTGSANEVFPGFKRYSAILGDIVFTITRRAFLNLAVGQGVPAWSYLATYLQSLATFGTLHGSDLAYNFDSLFSQVPPTIQQQTYYISFINYLNPNTLKSTATPTAWPDYNSTLPLLVNFNGGDISFINDTFRQEVYNYLLPHVFSFRV